LVWQGGEHVVLAWSLMKIITLISIAKILRIQAESELKNIRSKVIEPVKN